jgi:hypothetical protein
MDMCEKKKKSSETYSLFLNINQIIFILILVLYFHLKIIFLTFWEAKLRINFFKHFILITNASD